MNNITPQGKIKDFTFYSVTYGVDINQPSTLLFTLDMIQLNIANIETANNKEALYGPKETDLSKI